VNLGGHPEASHPFKPGFLFESGVRAWTGFPFEGVLWYQGETNAEIDDDAWNRRLISDLVTGWRKELGQEKLPFFLIQLPRIGGSDPLRKHWPAYRKVQAEAARSLAGVHLVVTEDLGWDSPDVHPPDKRPVAMRLAEAILGPGRR
jgi:sialate O-acetylesterase